MPPKIGNPMGENPNDKPIMEVGKRIGELVGTWLFDATHPETDTHPHDRSIVFTIYNLAYENLTGGTCTFKNKGQWWEKRPFRTDIGPREKAMFTAWNGGEPGAGGVEGWVSYEYACKGKVIIDFNNASLSKEQCIRATRMENDDGHYRVLWWSDGEFAGNATIIVGYDPHENKASGTQLQKAPAATTFSKDNKVYCVHVSNGGDGKLFWNTFDGGWSGDIQIREPNGNEPRMGSDRASLVEYNQRLYCFYCGTDSGELWYVTTDDGHIWSAATRVQNTYMSGSPSAVVYSNKIFVFHQDSYNKGTLWYNAFDGSNWSGENRPSEQIIMSESPSAVVWNDNIYVFVQGSGLSSQLWFCKFHASSGSQIDFSKPFTKIENVGLTGSPSAVVTDNQVRVYHEGLGGNGQLWSTLFKSDTEQQDWPVPGVGISYSPAAAVRDGKVHVVHHGSYNNRELWASTLPFNH